MRAARPSPQSLSFIEITTLEQELGHVIFTPLSITAAALDDDDQKFGLWRGGWDFAAARSFRQKVRSCCFNNFL
jgi:hypothetical protein